MTCDVARPAFVCDPNDNVIFTSIVRQMLPPPPPTRESNVCREVMRRTRRWTSECAVITGLGFQKEMTHPSDDVEKTMNTHII